MDNRPWAMDARQGGSMRLLVIPVLLLGLTVPPSSAVSAGPAPGSRVEVRHALGVLHAWDQRRARAWADSDATALRALYVPGSAAAAADGRLLRDYQARHLVVRRLETQVFGVRVLHNSRGRLTLRVLDRVAGGEVDEQGRTSPLPSSPPAVRRIVLARVDGTWKVASVTG